MVSHHPGTGPVQLPIEGEGEDTGLVRGGPTEVGNTKEIDKLVKAPAPANLLLGVSPLPPPNT